MLHLVFERAALNINPTKTAFDAATASIQEAVSAIHEELISIVDADQRPSLFLGSGVDSSDFDSDYESGEDDQNVSLDEDQVGRLLELLSDPRADEVDVEMILGILQENTDSVTGHVPYLLGRFPNIVKQLHRLTGLIVDKDHLTNEIMSLVVNDSSLIEYQLFWIAVIAEDHLSKAKNFGPLILKLYERTSEHKIARAKILEIPDQSFGLKEIRDEILKTGASDWQSWASAMGTRTLKKAERNYALKYFSKGSPLNYLIAECLQKLA